MRVRSIRWISGRRRWRELRVPGEVGEAVEWPILCFQRCINDEWMRWKDTIQSWLHVVLCSYDGWGEMHHSEEACPHLVGYIVCCVYYRFSNRRTISWTPCRLWMDGLLWTMGTEYLDLRHCCVSAKTGRWPWP
jgi:hypothetical protein